VSGVIRYEFVMQIRRRALWISFALLGSLFIAVGLGSMLNQVGKPVGVGGLVYSRHDVLLLWTEFCQLVSMIGAGLLLADRTPRDRKIKVIEVLRTAPAHTSARLIGKYIGGVLATLVLIALMYAIGIGIAAARWQDLSFLPLALAMFAALVLPPIFFVGAFSIACTTVLWTPLYQFLFVGFCAWSNSNPGEAIPTISGTLLAPAENYVVTGFFHYGAYIPIDKGFYPSSSVWLGIAIIAVLIGCGALALIGGWLVQRYQDNAQ
jgi:ABC-type transport system involved in multi-copper enzyme maturation permease subunit